MKEYNIQFVSNYKRFTIISSVVLAVILIATLIIGVQLDIQFSGGAIITYTYQGEVDSAQFGRVAQDAVQSPATVQRSTDLATGMETLILSMPGSLTTEQMDYLTEQLQAALPENYIHMEAIVNVSATMGREFLQKCLVAIAFAFVMMILFIAFRFRRIGGFSAGVMGVIGLIHGVAIVFGVHVILGIPLSGNFIAVVLAILGYSINDTIIIYDRIRENKRLYGDKLPLAELVNRSINQSLRRTFNTTVSTVAAMTVVAVVAVVFSIQTILTLAIPMIFGLLAGVYSSLCIAGPLWVRWRERAAG